jgi:hypothetical protein
MSSPSSQRRRPRLIRKAFFVDEREIRRAKRALGAPTDAEAVRLSVKRVAEMEEFWRFMDATHGTLKPDSFSE